MSSNWLSNLFPWPRIRLTAEKKTISLRTRIEVDRFKECEVKEVRRKRLLWREDKVDLVHKEPGRRIKFTPLP
jgi:hypothetical protein